MDKREQAIEKMRKEIDMYTDIPRHVDNILEAVKEAGYRLFPNDKTNPYPATVTDECTGQVFPDNRHVAWQEGRNSLLTLEQTDLRGKLVAQLKAVWLAGNCIRKFRPDEVPMESLGDIADKFLSLIHQPEQTDIPEEEQHADGHFLDAPNQADKREVVTGGRVDANRQADMGSMGQNL